MGGTLAEACKILGHRGAGAVTSQLESSSVADVKLLWESNKRI